MMNSAKPMILETSNDADLVGATIAGNRDAFAQIVARYQSLICSLAYSATGSISQSEDLAQETFLTAWQKLRDLREPASLRAWLCGIARNLINNSNRRQQREPSHAAASMEELQESAAKEPLPAEQSITNEENAILWRSLEQIPELYREPLVLFYREHQSIESVAEKLDLTEDTVKQRLSRGRKLLHEQVLAFVEGALEKTSPGKTFTLGVLAALPIATTTAKAVTLGSALAQGGAAAKGILSFGPIAGVFVFLGGMFYSLKGQVDETKSAREKRFVLMMTGLRVTFSFLTMATFFSIKKFSVLPHYFAAHPLFGQFAPAILFFIVCCIAVFFSEFLTERRRIIQVEEGTFVGEEWTVARKAGGRADTSGTSYFRTARFKAMLLCVIAFPLMMRIWTWGIAEMSGLLALWGLLWYLDYTRWKNNPRFTFQGRDTALMMAVMFALLTLATSGIKLWAEAGNADRFAVSLQSPGALAFNLGTIATYGLLIWFILRRRKHNLRSLQKSCSGGL